MRRLLCSRCAGLPGPHIACSVPCIMCVALCWVYVRRAKMSTRCVLVGYRYTPESLTECCVDPDLHREGGEEGEEAGRRRTGLHEHDGDSWQKKTIAATVEATGKVATLRALCGNKRSDLSVTSVVYSLPPPQKKSAPKLHPCMRPTILPRQPWQPCSPTSRKGVLKLTTTVRLVVMERSAMAK